MVTKVDTFTGEKVGAIEVLDTPNTPTIDSLVELFNTKYSANISAANTLKNVLIMADEKPISVLVPGDREVDLKRLGANLSGVKDLRLFEDADFAKYPKLVKGYVGPQDAKELGLKLYADPRVVEGSHWITGANKKDKHAKNVTCGRDFKVEQYVEAAEVKAGDNCPKCAKPVIIDRAIEIGHIFQLGQKYAKSLGLSVLDKEGKPVVVTMGSYGIGVSRAVAAIAEQTYDELGLCWPAEIAPADVHIVATGKEDKPFEVAEQIAKDLEAKGLEVLLDDRREASAGVKFKDAELIGISKIIIVGKSLADGKVEVRDRKSADKQEVVLADVVEYLVK
jgi:prolyl-tRNA synthetase